MIISLIQCVVYKTKAGHKISFVTRFVTFAILHTIKTYTA